MCSHSAVSRPAAATSLKRGRNGELSLAPSRPGRLGRMITKSADTQDMTRRRIALIAHDHKKQDLREWARYNRSLLTAHHLFATGTTGRLLGDELGLSVTCFQSGPVGGDQQIGGRIADGEIDLLIFFWDPLEPQPHDPDVKALLRVAVVWNIPVACNRATADFVISSPLISQRYQRQPPDYRTHADRRFPPGPAAGRGGPPDPRKDPAPRHAGGQGTPGGVSGNHRNLAASGRRSRRRRDRRGRSDGSPRIIQP